jgi:hypothetical protein
MKNVLTKTWLLGLLILILGAVCSTGVCWAKQWKDEVDAWRAERDKTIVRIDERLGLLPEIRDEQKRQRELMEEHFRQQSVRP